MARPLRISIAGGWYHVSSRGNRREGLFRNDTDRRRFLGLVAELPDRFSVQGRSGYPPPTDLSRARMLWEKVIDDPTMASAKQQLRRIIRAHDQGYMLAGVTQKLQLALTVVSPGEPVWFDGRGSSDSDGVVAFHEWDSRVGF